MSGYIGRTPLTPAVQKRESFVATAGQTLFSFTYTAGYLDVFLNGVKLRNTEDFAATNGNTVVLVTGATDGDEIDMVALYNFAAIDAYSKAVSDARFMDINAIALPSQTGFSGKYLKTDGTDATWAEGAGISEFDGGSATTVYASTDIILESAGA